MYIPLFFLSFVVINHALAGIATYALSFSGNTIKFSQPSFSIRPKVSVSSVYAFSVVVDNGGLLFFNRVVSVCFASNTINIWSNKV